MAGVRLFLAIVVALVVVGATSAGASAKGVLRLSEGGVPVQQGAEVSFKLVLRPDGFMGSTLQEGGGPLVNEAKLDGFTTNEEAVGQAGWLVDGSIRAVALSSAGKAAITTSGETIANNEPEGVEPVEPPPPTAWPAHAKWECFYPLPKKLTGTFLTSGVAVITGTTEAKTSKLCHLPGFSVSFTLELLPNGQGAPALSTSIVP